MTYRNVAWLVLFKIDNLTIQLLEKLAVCVFIVRTDKVQKTSCTLQHCFLLAHGIVQTDMHTVLTCITCNFDIKKAKRKI